MANHLKYRIDKKYKEKDTHIESALKSFFEKELNAKLEADSSSSLPSPSSRLDFCVYDIDKKPIVLILLAEIKTDKESQSSGSWFSFHKNKNYEHCHPYTEKIIKDLDAQEPNKQVRNFIIEFMCQLWEYKQATKCNNTWFVQEKAALYKKSIDKSLEILSQNHLLEVVKKTEYENLYIVRINFK